MKRLRSCSSSRHENMSTPLVYWENGKNKFSFVRYVHFYESSFFKDSARVTWYETGAFLGWHSFLTMHFSLFIMKEEEAMKSLEYITKSWAKNISQNRKLHSGGKKQLTPEKRDIFLLKILSKDCICFDILMKKLHWKHIKNWVLSKIRT